MIALGVSVAQNTSLYFVETENLYLLSTKWTPELVNYAVDVNFSLCRQFDTNCFKLYEAFATLPTIYLLYRTL